MKRWKHRPEGSTWGDWGDDDQLGRLNLITPAKVLEGIAEVKEGRSFCLSLPLDLPGGNVLNPRRLPPCSVADRRRERLALQLPHQDHQPLFVDVASDDRVILTLQYSTQWTRSPMSAASSMPMAMAYPSRSTTTASRRAST